MGGRSAVRLPFPPKRLPGGRPGRMPPAKSALFAVIHPHYTMPACAAPPKQKTGVPVSFK